MSQFNNKNFNATAFSTIIQNLPKLKNAELIHSNVLKSNYEIKNAFNSSSNTGFAILPMFGKIDGTPINYDGKNDLNPTSTNTYERGVVVVGRANAWLENDFAYDITGINFMDNVAKQVCEYFDDVDFTTILSILKGIFSMTDTENSKFVENHTFDITAETNSKIDVTSLNTAIQKACGDNKKKFSAVLMHSSVATNLENINLLSHLKYTDSIGVQRDLSLATWNGKIVIIDDSLYEVSTGKTAKINYITYILGNGAFDYENIGTKVPYEINRDPKTNGGQDTLYVRERKCFAPFGISYKKASQVSLSPTDEELSNGQNWTLVSDSNNKFIEHKFIPIARIISLG